MKAWCSGRDKKVKLLSALIAVFMVSGAMAQGFDAHDVSFAQKKKPVGFEGGADAQCDPLVRGAPSFWSCKDPKTGRTEKVKCKNPPKQKLQPIMTMSELKKACRP